MTYRTGSAAVAVYDVAAGTVEPLALDPGREIESVTWSRDGRLVFSSSRFARQEIELARGSAIRALTPGPEDTDPAWSPDGRRLAFRIVRGGYAHVALVPAAGGPARVLTHDRWNDFYPSFAPDGRTIVYTSNRTGADIYAMEADGHGQRLVAHSPRFDYAPSPSPDGTHVVFTSERSGAPQLYVARLDSAGVRRLELGLDAAYYPRYSPDGLEILFTGRHGGNVDLYVVGSDGRGLVRLTTETTNERWGSWSPNGRKIVFARDSSLLPSRLWVMDANGAHQRPLPVPAGADQPVWRPAPPH